MKEGRENGSFQSRKFCVRTSRGLCNGSTALHLPAFRIRATALLLAIPEHEVSQQARRSKREAGLAFFVAHWSPNSDPPYPLLNSRLHMITALEASAGRDFREFASASTADSHGSV